MTPKKPNRPPRSLVFPKHGRPYESVEHLPEDKDGLEFAIGKKFLGAKAHFRGQVLSDLERSDEPGDLKCRSHDGAPIMIQIAEVVDQNHRTIWGQRQSYAEAIVAEWRLPPAFAGCAVRLVDSGDPPYLPAVNGAEGRKCLAEIMAALDGLSGVVGALPIGNGRLDETLVGPTKRRISVWTSRNAENGDAAFDWTGGGPSYRSDRPRLVLTQCIKDKRKKSYSKPKAQFWLLTYSTDSPIDASEPDVLKAHEFLSANPHPFDKAWFLYPYDHVDLGHLFQVYPQIDAPTSQGE